MAAVVLDAVLGRVRRIRVDGPSAVAFQEVRASVDRDLGDGMIQPTRPAREADLRNVRAQPFPDR